MCVCSDLIGYILVKCYCSEVINSLFSLLENKLKDFDSSLKLVKWDLEFVVW